MCGIFGCIVEEGSAAPIIHAALKRLEYRGYDSAGEATISNGKICFKKDSGKIDEINKKLNFDKISGKIGIGHTRWATHGAPTKENAHPHLDCKKTIAVVHNGIIENFLRLRKNLEANGHIFRSRTDTEVIPHLIEEELGKGKIFVEAVRRALLHLKGSFAVAAIYCKEPDKIVCARKESPLIIGIGNNSLYLGSDIPAFLPMTNKAVSLEENQMAILQLNNLKVLDIKTGKPVKYKVTEIEWSAEMAEKSGFPHFMLKEIYEQPASLKNALLPIHEPYFENMANYLNKTDKIFMVACGTSYHACLTASYIFSEIAHLNVNPVIGSEFIEAYGRTIDDKTVVLAVSQSGETADTLNALRFAKSKHAKILSITNVLGSTITKLSQLYINQNSGPEIGVAATKTFTSQVAVLTKLAVKLAEKKRAIAPKKAAKIMKDLEAAPGIISEILYKTEPRVKNLVKKYKDKDSFCFLGRGINYATALEGRLKLLEISYVPALCYPAGESKHGFISVVHEGYPILFIAPNDETRSKIIGNIMEMKARNASVIALIEEGDKEIKKIVDDYVELPKHQTHLLLPIMYIVPLQLFAYYMAVERGFDPDKPRSLAKSVTVE